VKAQSLFLVIILFHPQRNWKSVRFTAYSRFSYQRFILKGIERVYILESVTLLGKRVSSSKELKVTNSRPYVDIALSRFHPQRNWKIYINAVIIFANFYFFRVSSSKELKVYRGHISSRLTSVFHPQRNWKSRVGVELILQHVFVVVVSSSKELKVTTSIRLGSFIFSSFILKGIER